MSQPSSPESEAVEVSSSRGFKDYFRWILRRFWILLTGVLGGFFLGLYLYSITPATYVSSATIEILRVKKDAADVKEEEQIRMTGAAEMLSASERLRLPQIYTEAAKSPILAERKDLVPKQRQFPWTDPPEVDTREVRPDTVGSMISRFVNVRWRTDTALLDLSASHTDPAVARDVLAAVLTAYEDLTQSRVEGSSEYALDYILKSSAEIKDKLLGLEGTLQLYERCSTVSKEIDEAERQIAEMEKRYLPKWPPLIEAKELLRILDERFVNELNQVISLNEEEKKFWDSNLKVLSNVSESDLTDAKRKLVLTRSNVLVRELEAEKQVYDNLILQLKEGNVARGFAGRQFEVVQPPTLPGKPAGPIRSKMLIQFAGGGFMLGLAIIFLLGILDPTIRTVAELEQLAGIPVIAALPAFTKRDTRQGNLALAGDTESSPAEAVRTLRAGLTFLGTAEERCTFLVTSSIPGEGKSWVASNLAHSFAAQGDRTLLIDADLRRPVQSEIFGYAKDSKGIADQLSLGTSLKEILIRSEYSENLFLMPAGSRSANPAELLSGKGLRPLIEKLTEYFDRIVIDSAPIVPVSDTVPIAKMVQSVVLVVRMGKTPKAAVNRTIRVLSENASRPVGLVANGMPKTMTTGSHEYYYSYTSGGSYSGYASKS